MHDTIIADLRQIIESTAGCDYPRPERRFHKDEEYLSYGLKTADFRKIMKEFRPRFLALPLHERLQLAAKLLGKHIGELGHAGIHMVALSVEEFEPSLFPALDRLVDDFRGWSHVDHFCGEVVQPLLWKHRKAMLALLQKWNRSPNRWKRRASVVAFTRKVGDSGEFTTDVLRLCENLIWDKEDIVRKGVGWALKDNLRSAPAQLLAFIRKLRRKGVSSTITLYAMRDLKGAARQTLLTAKRP